MLCRVRVLRRVPGVRGGTEGEDEGVMAEEVKVAGISVKMVRSEWEFFLNASGLPACSIWAWERRSRRVRKGLLKGRRTSVSSWSILLQTGQNSHRFSGVFLREILRCLLRGRWQHSVLLALAGLDLENSTGGT